MTPALANLIALVLGTIQQAATVLQTIQTAHANGTDITDEQVQQALADAQAAHAALAAAING